MNRETKEVEETTITMQKIYGFWKGTWILKGSKVLNNVYPLVFTFTP